MSAAIGILVALISYGVLSTLFVPGLAFLLSLILGMTISVVALAR
jgi:hypothetical protein